MGKVLCLNAVTMVTCCLHHSCKVDNLCSVSSCASAQTCSYHHKLPLFCVFVKAALQSAGTGYVLAGTAPTLQQQQQWAQPGVLSSSSRSSTGAVQGMLP
jgi:hypothetical protein